MTAIAVLLMLSMIPPFEAMTPELLPSGLATHYGGPGDPLYTVFRNGDPYAADAPVCAVDDSLWPDLKGMVVFVLSESGEYGVLRVVDTGRLYDAGRFRRGKHRWIPAETGLRVEIDIPYETFLRIFGTDDTQKVHMWVLR